MPDTETPRYTDPSYFAKHPLLEYAFIFSACCGQLITQSATTDALTHMYQLRDDFHAPDSMTPWYIASFGLALGTLIITSGRVGDAYGIRNTLVGGYIWTVVWSLLCGISWYDRQHGPSLYICCRTFQGAGVAFILPNVLGAVGRVYTPGTLRKNIVFGIVGLCAPLGGFIGVIFSGVIAVRTQHWYWNYYAFAIFVFVAGVITYISVPELPPHLTPEGKHQDLDLVGGFLIVASLTLFNFSWNEAPVVGWGKAYIIVLLAVSVPMFCLFIWWELKMAVHPLIPKEVLGNRRVVATLMILFFGWGVFGVNIYHYMTLLQQFRHYSPFAAGAALTPAPPMGAIAALSCAVLINEKTGEFILLGAMLAFTAAAIILATSGIHESYFRNTMGVWILAPFGMDWSFPAGSIILSEALPPHLQGLAGSLVSVCMNYGVSIFLGVAGTVEEQLLEQRPDDPWRAWRGALYFNIGLGGLASSIAFYFAMRQLLGFNSAPRVEDPEVGGNVADASSSGEEEEKIGNPNSRKDSISELSVDLDLTPTAGDQLSNRDQPVPGDDREELKSS